MNKYLMMSAAAAFSGVTAANAAVCFNFGSSGGGSYCDSGMVISGVGGAVFGGKTRGWRHLNADCNGSISIGYGLMGKTPGLGVVSLMSDNSVANYSSMAISYTLPKKIKRGAPWALWIGFGGTTMFEDNAGTLKHVTQCQNGVASHGRKSTLASVTEIVRIHRNARASQNSEAN